MSRSELKSIYFLEFFLLSISFLKLTAREKKRIIPPYLLMAFVATTGENWKLSLADVIF